MGLKTCTVLYIQAEVKKVNFYTVYYNQIPIVLRYTAPFTLINTKVQVK